MVHPFLHGALHLHLRYPVDVVGGGFVVGRFAYQLLNVFVGVIQHFLRIVAVLLQPYLELWMEHMVFFPRIADIINKGDLHILIVGIYFSASLVGRQKYRLDA